TGSEATNITSFERLPLWQGFLVPVIGGILAGLTLWIGNRLIARVRQKSTTDGDIMDENFPSISSLHSMRDALKKFSETRSERLPVVDNPTLQRLIGSISKTDVILHLAGEQSRPDSCDHAVEAGFTS